MKLVCYIVCMIMVCMVIVLATNETKIAKKEAGDILWCVAMLCESFGWNMEEIMQMNVDKLIARYPEGFDVERANHRAVGDV